jgi:hypothetical protein
MTDDPNATPEELAGEAGGEEAGDLDAAQLEAAAEGAENEVEGETAGEGGADLEDEAFVEAEAADESPIRPVGAPPRSGPEPRGPRVRAPKTTRTAFAIDPELRIKDPWSAVFVVIAVAVFALILANALLFGHGGAFTPIPTPSPVPTEGPSESPSAAPSTSPSAAPSVAPSPSSS